MRLTTGGPTMWLTAGEAGNVAPRVGEADTRFWDVVRSGWGGVPPRLHEGGGSPPPLPPRAFDPWGRGWSFPSWAAVMVAFLLGFISGNLVLFGPMWPAALLLVASLAALWAAVRRRWR